MSYKSKCRKPASLNKRKKHFVCFRIPEPRRDKTCLGGGGGVRHRQGCTATEDGRRLEISDLESRGIAANPRFCFPHMQKADFLMTRLIYECFFFIRIIWPDPSHQIRLNVKTCFIADDICI